MEHCEMVKDLLPLVAENMASEESTAFVKKHLETCESCRAAFDAMKAPVETDPAAPLKTVRKSVKKRGLLIAGFIACLVAATLVAVNARLFKPIVISSEDAAFTEKTIVPETIQLPTSQKSAETETTRDVETEAVKQAQQTIAFIIQESDDNNQSLQIQYIVVPDSIADSASGAASQSSQQKSDTQFVIKAPQSDPENDQTVAYMYTIPDREEANGQTLEPDAVIAPTPKTLKLTTSRGTKLLFEQTGRTLFIGAYTTLWDNWFQNQTEPQETEIELSDLDAVYFEPYNNTDHTILYQRDGFASESGFALPRLVMNYYFAFALIGAAALFVPWLVLLLLKKQKARRIFGILLLIPVSFAIAFAAAGYPATSINPVFELPFVGIIALLLIGAGLCGRKLFIKA